jgi:hypothetical protein
MEGPGFEALHLTGQSTRKVIRGKLHSFLGRS